MIERECQGLLEFLESPFTLDNVAGHEAVKAWLREDAPLLQRDGPARAADGLPDRRADRHGQDVPRPVLGGRAGDPVRGVQELPRQVGRGDRDRNLEKIFAILHALGQVVVFVDEADQAAGKRRERSGDSGLSGRVYAMLAKEMSDTRNRGRIIWVFATSRPDLLEVDLKRQGRLDVHIPLFPPQTGGEARELLLAMAKKLKFPVSAPDLPELPEGVLLGGNEVEGALVRALRLYELRGSPGSL